jgi:uncharacterized C2H2 Zn-finger protein
MDESHICEFCGLTFSSKSNLEAHKKRAKKCLKLQNKELPNDFSCKCGKLFTSNQNYCEHVKKCKYSDENQLHVKYETLKKEYDELKRKYDILVASTNTKPAVKRRNKHKLLDTLIPYDLDSQMINTIVNTSYTKQWLKNGNEGVAKFIVTNILTLHGRRKIMCTDEPRKRFVYMYQGKQIVESGKLSCLPIIMHAIQEKARQIIDENETSHIECLKDMADSLDIQKITTRLANALYVNTS